MNDRLPFNPLQAQEVAQAFNAAGVDYLFIGKSGAIFLGYPGTTRDVDVFPSKSVENGQRIVKALLEMGFIVDDNAQAEITRGKVFVQLKDGPFNLDLILLLRKSAKKTVVELTRPKTPISTRRSISSTCPPKGC